MENDFQIKEINEKESVTFQNDHWQTVNCSLKVCFNKKTKQSDFGDL